MSDNENQNYEEQLDGENRQEDQEQKYEFDQQYQEGTYQDDNNNNNENNEYQEQNYNNNEDYQNNYGEEQPQENNEQNDNQQNNEGEITTETTQETNQVPQNVNQNKVSTINIEVPDDVRNYPMYISQPVNNKGFISYTLSGTQIEESLQRRFSDFWAFREKLCERWPGVYIPNIPPKKAIGNKDTKVIDKRIRIINSFCLKLSQFPFLFNSEETKLFMTSNSELPKTYKTLQPPNYQELLQKYQESFTDYNEEYDVALGKSKLNEFLTFLKKSLVTIKNFQDVINKSYEKQLLDIGKYIELIHQFEAHEKYTVMEYSDGNENKLVFFNPMNSSLSEKVMYLGQSLKNPYSSLSNWAEEEILDYEAMIEALVSLNDLQTALDKLNAKLEGIDKDIRANKYNQVNPIKTLFKKKEEQLTELEKDKEITETNISNLDLIIKLASFNMEIFVEKFKKIKVNEYYKQLLRYSAIQKENNKGIKDVWDSVKDSLAQIHKTN